MDSMQMLVDAIVKKDLDNFMSTYFMLHIEQQISKNLMDKLVIELFQTSIAYNAVEILHYLLEQNNSIMSADAIVQLYFDAVKLGRLDIVKQFITFGQDYNIKDENGRNIMHIAAIYNQKQLFNYLSHEYKELKTQTDKYKKYPREYKLPFHELQKSQTQNYDELQPRSTLSNSDSMYLSIHDQFTQNSQHNRVDNQIYMNHSRLFKDNNNENQKITINDLKQLIFEVTGRKPSSTDIGRLKIEIITLIQQKIEATIKTRTVFIQKQLNTMKQHFQQQTKLFGNKVDIYLQCEDVQKQITADLNNILNVLSDYQRVPEQITQKQEIFKLKSSLTNIEQIQQQLPQNINYQTLSELFQAVFTTVDKISQNNEELELELQFKDEQIRILEEHLNRTTQSIIASQINKYAEQKDVQMSQTYQQLLDQAIFYKKMYEQLNEALDTVSSDVKKRDRVVMELQQYISKNYTNLDDINAKIQVYWNTCGVEHEQLPDVMLDSKNDVIQKQEIQLNQSVIENQRQKHIISQLKQQLNEYQLHFSQMVDNDNNMPQQQIKKSKQPITMEQFEQIKVNQDSNLVSEIKEIIMQNQDLLDELQELPYKNCQSNIDKFFIDKNVQYNQPNDQYNLSKQEISTDLQLNVNEQRFINQQQQIVINSLRQQIDALLKMRDVSLMKKCQGVGEDDINQSVLTEISANVAQLYDILQIKTNEIIEKDKLITTILQYQSFIQQYMQSNIDIQRLHIIMQQNNSFDNLIQFKKMLLEKQKYLCFATQIIHSVQNIFLQQQQSIQ